MRNIDTQHWHFYYVFTQTSSTLSINSKNAFRSHLRIFSSNFTKLIPYLAFGSLPCKRPFYSQLEIKSINRELIEKRNRTPRLHQHTDQSTQKETTAYKGNITRTGPYNLTFKHTKTANRVENKTNLITAIQSTTFQVCLLCNVIDIRSALS